MASFHLLSSFVICRMRLVVSFLFSSFRLIWNMSLAMSARASMTSRLECLLRTLSMHFALYAVSFIKDGSARLSSK